MMTTTANVYSALFLCLFVYMFISLNHHSKSTKMGSSIITTSLVTTLKLRKVK